MNVRLRATADALLRARLSPTEPARYPQCLPANLREAYAIQDQMIAAIGRPIIGWKVARLPAPMAAEAGAAGIVGPIFEACQSDDAAPVAAGVYGQGFAAGEAEYLLQVDLPPAGGLEIADAAHAIARVHVGVEIAGSPVADILTLGASAIASDLGINTGIVVGPAVADWQLADLESRTVVTEIDGVEVGRGRAAGLPGGLAMSLVILSDTLSARGHRLRPDQWVASGALTGVHPVQAGQAMRVTFGGGASVAIALEPLVTWPTPMPNKELA